MGPQMSQDALKRWEPTILKSPSYEMTNPATFRCNIGRCERIKLFVRVTFNPNSQGSFRVFDVRTIAICSPLSGEG